MELSFSQLKQKDVVSVTDGKNLGKVCDISLTFPDNNWLGITVTGCKGFKLTNKKELFIPAGEIVKNTRGQCICDPCIGSPSRFF